MGPLEFPAWDPVLLDLPGPIDVRWYGLMYIVGFVAGQVILTRLARARFLPVEPERVADLVFYSIIGTILGGRIGYALFYDQGLVDPLKFVRVWEGGLSFHGGLLGVIAAMWLFARRNKVPLGRVLDSAAIAVTPGIFAVRIANFINGELFGRVTTADMPFAMRFPTDGTARALLMLDEIGYKRDEELAIQYAYRHVDWDSIRPALHETSPRGQPIPWEEIRARLEDWDQLKQQVPYRHPSQLYEAFGEGLLVGLLLLIVYLATRKRPLPPWTYGGLFVLGYGVVRFFIEYFRQPDSQFRDRDDPLGTVLFGMTMGQVLCSAMILVGGALVVRGVLLRRKENAERAQEATTG